MIPNTASAEPSFWITDTVAEVPERVLPRARPTGTWGKIGRGNYGWGGCSVQ